MEELEVNKMLTLSVSHKSHTATDWNQSFTLKDFVTEHSTLFYYMSPIVQLS